MEDFPYFVKARGKFRVSAFVVTKFEESERVTYFTFLS